MKVFRCTSCGGEVARDTQPLKCPHCQRQAIGLFRLVPGATAPSGPAPGAKPPAAAPSAQFGMPGPPLGQPPAAQRPAAPPPTPGIPAGPLGMGRPPGGSPLSAPPPPGGVMPARPATPGYGPPGVQPAPMPPQTYAPPTSPPVASPPPLFVPTPPPQVTPQPPVQASPPPQVAPPQIAAPPQVAAPSQPAPPQQEDRLKAGLQPVAPQAPAVPAAPPRDRAAPPSPPPQRRPPAEPPRKPAPTAPPQAARPAAPPASKPPARGEGPPAARRPKPAAPEPEAPRRRPRTRPQPIRPKQFVWAYPGEPPYADEALAMKNAPAVDASGRVLLVTQGRLVALVEEQGQPRVVWDYVIGAHVPGRVLIGPDGLVRFHSADGLVHCVTEDGKQAFSPVHVGEPLGFAAPLGDRAGNTWVSAYDGGLVRITPDGRPSPGRYFRTRQKLDSAGVISGEVLYIGSEEGYIFAIDTSGERGMSCWNHAAEQGYAGGFVNSSPALAADGTLVVSARDQAVYCFGPGGTATGVTNIPGQLLGSPVIDRHGHIYVGASLADRGQRGEGALVCIDGNSRKIRWQHPVAAAVESTPVIGDDGVLYFGDNAGTIHAVDDRGNGLWTARVEAAVRTPGAIIAPGRLAFGLDDDTLVVLECSSRSLAPEGWPKIGRDLAQSGVAASPPRA